MIGSQRDKKDQKSIAGLNISNEIAIYTARIGVSTKGCTMYLTCE